MKNYMRKLVCRSLVTATFVALAPHLHAQDFNLCKAESSHSDQMSCLERLSRDYFQALSEESRLDQLTPKVFHSRDRDFAYVGEFSVVQGMHLEEPNNLQSGQYFATSLAPYFGILQRSEAQYGLRLWLSRFVSTGVGDEGLKRIGRPEISVKWPVWKGSNKRIFLTTSIKAPLVSGTKVGDFDRIWEIRLGNEAAVLLSPWFLLRVNAGLTYNSEKSHSYSAANSPEVGVFSQSPVLLRSEVRGSILQGPHTFSLIARSLHSIVTGRTIYTNDPSRPSPQFVVDRPATSFAAVGAGYERDFPNGMRLGLEATKSVQNQWPTNVDANADNVAETAAVAVNAYVQFAF